MKFARVLLIELPILSLMACGLSSGRVLSVQITSRQDVLDGRNFGAAGSYERITGLVHFSVALTNPRNDAIVDLNNAVNVTGSEVEFSADLVLVRPKQRGGGNGSMLLEVPNRGRARILSLVDGGDAALAQDAGDAWLLRNGFTVATLGWQWDSTGNDALRLYAPIAKDNGQPITGLLRGDLMPSKTLSEIPLGHFISGSIGGSEYPVCAPDDPRNVLTWRDSREGPRQVIPRSRWQFAHLMNGRLEASRRFIHLNEGFQPGKIYEYIYVVSDPVIAGLGFAAVRDFAAYAKYAKDAIAPAVRVYGEGISQNGRFLRDFLYEGFNADEEGRMALDGVLAHVAGAGRGSFNYRFAQPSRDAQPTSSIVFPTDLFPFTDRPEQDPITGVRAGLLDRVEADRVAPKIFFSNTSYEYWGRAASLIHTTADSRHDAEIGPNVRIYHFTGLQHFSGPFPPSPGRDDLASQNPQSPLPVRYFWRAMIANMDAWVRSGRTPPPSSHPKISDGTLVPLQVYAFPRIPHLQLPEEATAAYDLDFGPNWQHGILSIQPPRTVGRFPVLVPQVNADGNERDGVQLPELVVPLATYTGWNLRSPMIGAPTQRVAFEGSYLPFVKTKAERDKFGDPRLSVAERYSGKTDYIEKFERAAKKLIEEHWLLPEDRDSLLRRGESEWDEAMK
ncbi:MAG: hypothetical protein JWP08_1749 [Bryobacterales bacterium]|nr:hypothetical protein [Bryobacterales bacterium]